MEQINIDSVRFYQDTLKIKAYTFANYYLMHNEEIIVFPQDNSLFAVFRNDMDIYRDLKESIINSGRIEF